jgi:hypothetical protein
MFELSLVRIAPSPIALGVTFLLKKSKKCACWLQKEIAKSAHDPMRWNQADRILHGDVLDVVTKFGDDSTKFQLYQGGFCCKRELKIRPAGLEMGLLTL